MNKQDIIERLEKRYNFLYDLRLYHQGKVKRGSIFIMESTIYEFKFLEKLLEDIKEEL